MGKQAKALATVPSITLQGTTATTQPAVLQLVPGAKVCLRGQRAAWYALLAQYNGQPASAFLAAGNHNPPAVRPCNGTAAPAAEWLRWFVRNGYVVTI